MTNKKHWFKNLQPMVKGVRGVKVANDQCMQVAGVSVIEIHFLIEYTWHQGVIQHVLYVPNLKINLLPIGQMIEKYIISLYEGYLQDVFKQGFGYSSHDGN